MTGSDWIAFTPGVNDRSFTSDGTITSRMIVTKSYVALVCSPSFANKDLSLFGHVAR